MLDPNELDHYLAVALAAVTTGAHTLSDAHGPGRITVTKNTTSGVAADRWPNTAC